MEYNDVVEFGKLSSHILSPRPIKLALPYGELTVVTTKTLTVNYKNIRALNNPHTFTGTPKIMATSCSPNGTSRSGSLRYSQR